MKLREELAAAVASGVVPEVYVREVSLVVSEIHAQIPPCEQAQVPPPPRDRGHEDDDD